MSEPQRVAHRWWETHGGRDAQQGRDGELLTGGRPRSRPERSLSVGVDVAEDASSALRAYLWPIVGAGVAVVTLIVLVVLALVL
jgi:hypothetical protein